MRVCDIDGCERKHSGRGLCVNHLYRFHKHGDPMARVVSPLMSMDDRLWSKVDRSGECWDWTGHAHSNGYGSLRVNGKAWLAHRLAYHLEKGPIPAGMVIDHLCHRVQCVRPEHLQAVTQKQNVENRNGAQRNSKSGVRGVRQRTVGSWEVRVHSRGTPLYTAYFPSMEEAEAAAVAKRNELFTNNLADRSAV